MKRRKAPREANYVRKLRHLARLGAFPRGDCARVEVFHDDWCAFFQGERCNCNPEIRLKHTIPGTMN